MSPILIIRTPVFRDDLRPHLLEDTLVKAVVDCRRRIMAVGGDLHSDEEQLLLEEGSSQVDLWGINLYPDERSEQWVEFDSMINLRPSFGNRSRGVDDSAVQATIRSVVRELVRDA